MATDQEKTKAELEAEIRLLRKNVALLREQQAALSSPYLGATSYPSLVEAMTEGLAVQNSEGRIVYVNRALCEISGYSREDFIGNRPQDFLPEYQQKYYEGQMQLRKAGGRQRYEMTWMAKGNHEIQTLVSPAPIFNDEGDYCGAFALFADLTARKHIEEELDRERTLLRTLMDHLPDSVYVKDCQGRYILVNDAKCKQLGIHDQEAILGKTSRDFFAKPLAEKFHTSDIHVLRSGQAQLNVLERVQNADGSLGWELSSKVPLHDSNDGLMGVVGISRDITHRKQIEEALAASEERFRQILEYSCDVAFKLNFINQEYEYVSSSVDDLIGYSAEEVIAMGPQGLCNEIHPTDRKKYDQDQRRFLSESRRGHPFQLKEYRIRHKNGEYRWVAESTTMLLDERNEPVASVGAIRDITESKKTEEALRAASRLEATATLAGGIAHDFNNLMAAVLGNAELLELRMPEDPDTSRMLEAIAKAAEQAGHLAQQMLAFARGGKYEARVLNLNEVIRDMLRLEKHSFEPRITVESKLEEGLWSVRADSNQISQVVMNLSINAVEAIEGDGCITLSTHNEERSHNEIDGLEMGRYVCLEVRDRGCGMSEEVQARVFEPFFSTKFQGRGLGLAAVYGIVRNHNGHILLESEAGFGSCFKIFLPAIASEPTQKKLSKLELPLGSETILLVDDETMVLSAAQRVLERLGYRVLSALNGREAVDLAEQYEAPIDLIILDMAMPVMNGQEAFPLLRKARPKTKVVICSGFELGAAAQSLLEQGASAFIQKPLRMQEMALRLREVLDA